MEASTLPPSHITRQSFPVPVSLTESTSQTYLHQSPRPSTKSCKTTIVTVLPFTVDPVETDKADERQIQLNSEELPVSHFKKDRSITKERTRHKVQNQHNAKKSPKWTHEIKEIPCNLPSHESTTAQSNLDGGHKIVVKSDSKRIHKEYFANQRSDSNRNVPVCQISLAENSNCKNRAEISNCSFIEKSNVSRLSPVGAEERNRRRHSDVITPSIKQLHKNHSADDQRQDELYSYNGEKSKDSHIPSLNLNDSSLETPRRQLKCSQKVERSDSKSADGRHLEEPRKSRIGRASPTLASAASSELTDEVVAAYIDRHPHLLQRWLRPEACSSGSTERGVFVAPVFSRPGSRSPPSEGSTRESSSDSHLASVNYSCASHSSDVPVWLSPGTGPTRASDAKKSECLTEQELFMELIRDISTELDIDTLCHKILVNVGHLTHADRASLFLAQGPRHNRYLVAKLFDVTVDSVLEQALSNAQEKEILLPWGVGIVGHVASTKEILNIRDAYQDPRFDSSVDQLTGYRTNSVLCMPVCNFEGTVIGVAEIINKKNGSNEFTPHDVEVFKRYLTFCGIGIQNAQLFDISMQEYKRNQLLLQLARGIFEEQTSLDRLVTKIMTEARDLLKCEKCAVYLIDRMEHDDSKPTATPSPLPGDGSPLMESSLQLIEDADDSSSKMACLPEPDKVLSTEVKMRTQLQTSFELQMQNGNYIISRLLPAQLAGSPLAKLASYVADKGRTLNISDVQAWLGAPLQDAGQLIYSVLTIPVYNAHKQILGVAQMINKENGMPFGENDIRTFEAFAIFSGLGIQNTQVYEKACRLMARQKVALECLSYHATATQEDTDRLRIAVIPNADSFQLYDFDFSDLNLTDEETCMCVMRMFHEFNFLEIFKIPHEVLCRYVLSVKKNYRPVKYHNWRHALTVAQTMFAMLKTGKMELFMTEIEMLGLLVACLSHDLDHRGTNNSFQTKTDSPLAVLYSTSTMEHHHFDQCVMILSQDSNNIFQMLSAEDYRRVMRVVEKAILSTDMAMYFKKKNTFLELSDNGEFDWQSPDKKDLLCGMMMTACDVSAIAKPWEVQHKVAKLVADEFFEQGDLERLKLNEQPVAMMDRDKKDELPQMQVGFITAICLPLYKALSESFPWVKPLYDGCDRNRIQWEHLKEQVEMGLTWIDHDCIEDPVERNNTEVVSKITLNPKTLPSDAPSQLTSRQSVDISRHRRGLSLMGRHLKGGNRRVSLRRPTITFGDLPTKPVAEFSTASRANSVSSAVTEEAEIPSKRRNRLCCLL